MKENEVVAAAMKVLFELGSEHVEAINAISGDRCNPHPHTFADRLLRPGDQAFFDIIHSFMGYRTCYYRTFNVSYATPSQLDAYKQCREWLDDAIDLVRPGVTTDKIAEVWPTAQEIGMTDERAAFGLQFGHGLGVGLYEFPMISRLHSFDAPVELEVGMVFALETYCPATRRPLRRTDRGGGRSSPRPARACSRASRRTTCSSPARCTCAAPTCSTASSFATSTRSRPRLALGRRRPTRRSRRRATPSARAGPDRVPSDIMTCGARRPHRRDWIRGLRRSRA